MLHLNRSRLIAASALALSTFAIVGSTPASATGGLSTGAAGSINAADGNLVTANGAKGSSPDGTFDGSPTPDTEDWATTNACTGGTVVGCRLTGTDTTRSQSDSSLGQGTKEDSAVPTVTQGSIPNNKSDLSRFYVQSERGTVASHDATILDLAWERVNTLGTANMDFEFNQSSVLTANGSTVVRTAGDVLITFDFANGGNTVNLGLLRWLTSGSASGCFSSSSLPCWGNRVDLNSAVVTGTSTHIAQGAVNDGFAVTDSLPPGTGTMLPADTFGEASIDLTDVPNLFLPGKCTTLGSAWLKSRSSASFTAEEKDFIPPVGVDVSNCGSATIYKQNTSTSPHSALAGATFTIYNDNAPLNGTFGDPTKAYNVSGKSTTLTSPVADSTTTTVNVADSASTWASATVPFYVNIGSETMQVTGVDAATGKVLTVARGVLGTTAAAHAGTAAVNYATIGEDSFLTNAGTLTTQNFPASTGTVTVADATALPAVGTSFYALVDSEVVIASVTNLTTNTVTVSARAQDGTLLAAHNSPAALKPLDTCVTAGSFTPPSPATGSAAECKIQSIQFGKYWIVETKAPTGFGTAPPQNSAPGINADNMDESFVFLDAETPTSVNVTKTDDRDGTPQAINICTATVTANCAGFTMYVDAAPVGTAWHDPSKYYDTATTTKLGASGVDGTVTTVPADVSTAGWPSTATPPFVIRIENELMTVSAINSAAKTLTVTRGVAGTTAVSHSAGVTVTLEQPGEDGPALSNTCDVLDASNPSTCTFQQILPGSYWVVETTTPNGYVSAAPQGFTYSVGDSAAARNFTFVDPRRFKVLTFVCTENNNSLYGAKVTLNGTTLDSATSLPSDIPVATLCGLDPGTGTNGGGAVFPHLQKDTTSPSTTHSGDVKIGYSG